MQTQHFTTANSSQTLLADNAFNVNLNIKSNFENVVMVNKNEHIKGKDVLIEFDNGAFELSRVDKFREKYFGPAEVNLYWSYLQYLNNKPTTAVCPALGKIVKDLSTELQLFIMFFFDKNHKVHNNIVSFTSLDILENKEKLIKTLERNLTHNSFFNIFKFNNLNITTLNKNFEKIIEKYKNIDSLSDESFKHVKKIYEYKYSNYSLFDIFITEYEFLTKKEIVFLKIYAVMKLMKELFDAQHGKNVNENIFIYNSSYLKIYNHFKNESVFDIKINHKTYKRIIVKFLESLLEQFKGIEKRHLSVNFEPVIDKIVTEAQLLRSVYENTRPLWEPKMKEFIETTFRKPVNEVQDKPVIKISEPEEHKREIKTEVRKQPKKPLNKKVKPIQQGLTTKAT